MDKIRAAKFAEELKGKSVGEWTVGPLIDNGASAAVFEAQHDGHPAAIKIFDPELVERVGEGAQLARIETEIQLVGKLHENLVKIYGGGQCATTKLYFVVMELLRLPKLSKFTSTFPPEKVRPFLAQIASAAEFLESLGLVHRDIKPDNIVISEDFERAVLLDFGVLKPLDPSKHNDRGTGDQFLATTRYSSPEYLFRTEEDSQAGWRALTFYQLGGVAHDMIMRRMLFDGYGPPAARLIEAVQQRTPVIDNPHVPLDLQQLARNCLQKNWRVRNELTSWSDFSTDVPKAYDLEGVKERIRKRLTAATLSATAPVQTVEDGPQARKRLIESLLNQIASLVREIRQQGGILPPLEITTDATDLEHPATIRIDMPSSDRYDLKQPLTISMELELMDQSTSAMRITAIAFLGDRSAINLKDADWKPIFAGTFEPTILLQRLEQLLHSAFDLAQISVHPGLLDLPFLPKE
jgi:serine/threonine protein kinase